MATKDMKILIAEQSRNMADSLTSILSNIGYDVDVCYDGVQAFNQAAEKAYDIVIMEMSLPRINGYELINLFRKQEIKASIIGILDSSTISEQELRNNQCQFLLTKPFKIEVLISAIEKCIVNKDVELGEITYSNKEKSLIFKNNKAKVDAIELAFLEKVYSNSEKVITIQELKEILMDEKVFGNVLSRVRVLNAKLEKLGISNKFSLLENRGYILE